MGFTNIPPSSTPRSALLSSPTPTDKTHMKMEASKTGAFPDFFFFTAVSSEIKTVPGAEQALRKIPVNGSHERRKKWLENVLPLAAHFRDPLAFGRVTILIDVSV